MLLTSESPESEDHEKDPGPDDEKQGLLDDVGLLLFGLLEDLEVPLIEADDHVEGVGEVDLQKAGRVEEDQVEQKVPASDHCQGFPSGRFVTLEAQVDHGGDQEEVGHDDAEDRDGFSTHFDEGGEE